MSNVGRPIRIIDMLYSSYSGARYQHADTFQQQTLASTMQGVRHGAMVHDALLPTCMHMEAAHLFKHAAIISLDRVMCFDRRSWDITARLLKHIGFLTACVNAILKHHVVQRLYFTINGSTISYNLLQIRTKFER